MKIIHTADIHLGAVPDSVYPWGKERKISLWDTFKRLIKRTASVKADMLIISGDLFDRQPTDAELAEVNYLFSTILGTKVVICAGNHDFIADDSRYPSFKWSKNVTGLWSDKCTSAAISELDTRVYGLSYHDREMRANTYADVRPYGNEKTHILLFHGGDAAHCPINKSSFRDSEFDYIAMGHIHKPGAVVKNKAVYCGALEPIDSSDIGKHGYVEVDIKDGRVRNVRFVEFAESIYDTIELDCGRMTSYLELEEGLKEAVREHGEKNSYRLILHTENDCFDNIKLQQLWRAGRFIDVRVERKRENDIEELKRMYPGTFLESYIKRLQYCEDDVGREALKKGIEKCR